MPVPTIFNQAGSPRFVPTNGYNSGCLPGPRYATRVMRDGHCTIDGVDGLPQPEGTDLEDCRLFMHGGVPYAAYTEGAYEKHPFIATQRLARLKPDLSFDRDVPLKFAFNGGGVQSEKNWQFFSHKNRIHFVYAISPHVVGQIDEKGVIHTTQVQTKIHWPWGYMAGGTPPVRHRGEWVSFFHSFIVCKVHHRRYFAAAYSFNDRFEVTRVSRPIWVGSEEDPVNKPHPKGLNWDPLVVFPTGCILEKDTFRVCMGVNDRIDVVASLHHDEIPWEPVQNWTADRLVYWKTSFPQFPAVKWGSLGKTLGRFATRDPHVLASLYRAPGAQQITQDEYTNLRRQRV